MTQPDLLDLLTDLLTFDERPETAPGREGNPDPMTHRLTILHTTRCTACGKTMPPGTPAVIPGWKQLIHEDPCTGDAPDTDRDD